VNFVDPSGLWPVHYPEIRTWETDASQHGPAIFNPWAMANEYLERENRLWINAWLHDRREFNQDSYGDIFGFMWWPHGVPRPQESIAQRHARMKAEWKKKLDDCIHSAYETERKELSDLPGWRSILPTREDYGIAATGGGLTTAWNIFREVRTLTAIGAGVGSFGISLLAVPAAKFVTTGLSNALTSDEIHARRKAAIEGCHKEWDWK
jgi:hypothetical protein